MPTPWSEWYAQQAGAGGSDVVQTELRRLGIGGGASTTTHAPAAAPDRALAQRSRATRDDALRQRLRDELAARDETRPLEPSAIASLAHVAWDDGHPVRECSICMRSFAGATAPIPAVVRLPCSALHVFHRDCIEAWLRRAGSCPMCRQRPATTMRRL